jgi:hypothetical protein
MCFETIAIGARIIPIESTDYTLLTIHLFIFEPFVILLYYSMFLMFYKEFMILARGLVFCVEDKYNNAGL